MTAIEIREPGPPQVLRALQRATPQPASGEVLIRVVAAGVNRPDVLQRKGAYAPPPGASDIPGLEVAGEVVALGAGVREPAVGARVCALVAGGGYAQYVNVPAVQCLPVPGKSELRGGRGAAGDLLHRVAERVRACAPAAGRDAAGARRLERHRHHRHHARQGLRGARHRDGRQRAEVRGLPRARRGRRDQLPRDGLRRGDAARHRRQGRRCHSRHGRR